MVSALLVARNSSTACLSPVSSSNLRCRDVTGSDAPDSQDRTAGCDFGVAVQRLLEHELGPAFDRTGHGIAAMIEIDRGKAVLLRQNIGNAIAVSGLHSGERSGVICPGIGIRYAGVSLRTVSP